jgi:hypothetical protein
VDDLHRDGHRTTFVDLMTKFTGSESGRGWLMTFRDSSWMLTVAIFHQGGVAENDLKAAK